MVFTVDYQLVRLNGDVVPRMATSRLVLRPMLESDVARYLAQASKTGEADVLGGMPDRHAYEELCRHHAAEWRVSGMGYLVIADRASNDAIGHVQLRPIERATGARAAEITYSIDPPHRGRGYSVEAAAAMLLLAFEILGVDPVIAFVPMDNAASFAVALRLGFEMVGENLVHKSMMRRMLMTFARWQALPAASLSRI